MATARPAASKIMRGTLRSVPGPSGAPGSFHLPCRKIVLQYNDTWPSSRGARDYVVNGQLSEMATRNPSVEVVLQDVPARHPLLRGFYVNGREKHISLRNLSSAGVAEKVQLCLEQSGRKLRNLKHSTVVGGAEESARGIWSALHQPAPREQQ